MRILVTGANGQLGTSLRVLADECKDEFIFTDVSTVEGVQTIFLDITDADAVKKFAVDNKVSVIINCAAYTNVDAAEDNEEIAEKLNAGAPENLALAALAADALLVHVSTDYVFGGDQVNTPISENATVNPLGVYGQTKLHGEWAIRDSGCRSIIIRTAWLYSEYGKNFVKIMLDLTGRKYSLNVVFDQVGSPTYAPDLAKAIMTVIHSGKGEGGVYHFTNEGVCSWFDFTKIIAKCASKSGNHPLAQGHSCEIKPCHSDEFPSKVTRPSYSVLDKTLYKNTFGADVPYWTDSLQKCIYNLLCTKKA